MQRVERLGRPPLCYLGLTHCVELLQPGQRTLSFSSVLSKLYSCNTLLSECVGTKLPGWVLLGARKQPTVVQGPGKVYLQGSCGCLQLVRHVQADGDASAWLHVQPRFNKSMSRGTESTHGAALGYTRTMGKPLPPPHKFQTSDLSLSAGDRQSNGYSHERIAFVNKTDDIGQAKRLRSQADECSSATRGP